MSIIYVNHKITIFYLKINSFTLCAKGQKLLAGKKVQLRAILNYAAVLALDGLNHVTKIMTVALQSKPYK